MSTSAPVAEIRLNGEPFQTPAGSTVADLVRQLQLAPDRVAVELDGRIVRRPDWGQARLEAGCLVEVVQLVGGG